MEITEAKIFLRENVEKNKKLKAYVTITFDNAFVVRDIKVIEGNKGLFVAMPSKKDKIACSSCRYKNVVRSKFCNQCGSKIDEKPFTKEDYQNEHKDIAHPITSEAREYIQQKVLEAYEAEAGEYVPSVEQETAKEEKFEQENVEEEAVVVEEVLTEEVSTEEVEEDVDEEESVEEDVDEEESVEEDVDEEESVEEEKDSFIGDIGEIEDIDVSVEEDEEVKEEPEEDK